MYLGLSLYTYKGSPRVGIDPNPPLVILAETERIEADIKEHFWGARVNPTL